LPVYGYENRPAPKSTLPGEWTAETQPFPFPDSLLLSPLGWSMSRIWGPNDEELQYCKSLASNFSIDKDIPIYTPLSMNGSIIIPGVSNGINFDGCATDSKGMCICFVTIKAALYKVLMVNESIPDWCEEYYPQSDTPYSTCRKNFYGKLRNPCMAPPWVELVMLNLSKPEVVWRKPFGNGYWEGRPGQRGGPILTQGGLIFAGSSSDRNLWAIDAATGEPLWKFPLEPQPTYSPMTYRVKNKQYVVINCANATIGKVYAFTLPTIDEGYWWIYLSGVGALLLVIVIIVVIRARRKFKRQNYQSI